MSAELAIILNPNGRIAGQSSPPAAIPDSILARMRGVAQPVGTRPETAGDPHEYAFLVGSLLDHATLRQAEREAVLSGVTTHAVLIASGCISQPGYTAALAQALGLEAALWGMVIDGSSTVLEEAAAVDGLPALVRGFEASCPGVAFELQAPVGEDPRVLDLIAKIAGE